MKIFAIELSTSHGSIALVENETVVAEKIWVENFKNRQQLFDGISSIMQEEKMEWADIDVFAVGRGPGAFSGMRISLTVADALAKPAGKSVYLLNSGQVLVAQVAEKSDAEHVAVVGDARRKKIWAGLFSSGELTKGFELMESEQLSAFLPPDTLVLSPDHDRLRELLVNFRTLEPAEPVFPAAGMLGRLVFQRLGKGLQSEPAEPLYMHPPVFVEPRFSA